MIERQLVNEDLPLLKIFLEKSSDVEHRPADEWLEEALASELCCISAAIHDGEIKSICVGCSFEFYLKMRAPSCWTFAWSQNLPNASIPLSTRKMMSDIIENYFSSMGMNVFYAIIDWRNVEHADRHVRAFAKLNNISSYTASLFSVLHEQPTEANMAIERWLAAPLRRFPVAIIRMQK